MRTVRIMAALIFLCFTFAGSSTVWAEKIEVDHVKIEKVKDAQGNFKIKRDDTVIIDNQTTVVTLDNLVNLLREKPDSHVITKDNPTCYWYWDGSQWRKYCW